MSTRRTCLLDEQAALGWLEDGMSIALGEPAPLAMVRAIVRKGLRDLTVIGGGLAIDLLIAAGCVRKTVCYYAGGGTGVPVAPSFRHAAEQGAIEVWECEEGILTSGLDAAARGLPFLPWRGGVGTSLPALNPDLKVITDPVAGETLLAVPAITPDVALVHAAVSDPTATSSITAARAGWTSSCAGRHVAPWCRPSASCRTKRSVPTLGDHSPAPTACCACPGVPIPFTAAVTTCRTSPSSRPACSARRRPRSGERAALEDFLDHYCRAPADHVAYLERIGLARLLALHEY